jgi:hypothetical protein
MVALIPARGDHYALRRHLCHSATVWAKVAHFWRGPSPGSLATFAVVKVLPSGSWVPAGAGCSPSRVS